MGQEVTPKRKKKDISFPSHIMVSRYFCLHIPNLQEERPIIFEDTPVASQQLGQEKESLRL